MGTQKTILDAFLIKLLNAKQIRLDFPVTAMIPEPIDASVIQDYLDSLLSSVQDFICSPEVKFSKPEDENFSKLVNADPWVTLAVSTGLDPDAYNAEQRLHVISTIRKQFPYPRDLVALIIESPTDPRLNFETLMKGDVDIESKIAILEQQVWNNREAELVISEKLHGIHMRNGVWMENIKKMLGIVEVVDSSEDDWMSDGDE